MAKMLIDVPDEVRKKFRIICLDRGTTMKKELTGFMKCYIKTYREKNNQVK